MEQYPTSPHIASRILHTAHSEYDDIESASIADLGVGCGVLSAGAIYLNSAFNVGFDIDFEALVSASSNFLKNDLDVDLVQADVKQILYRKSDKRLVFDTVIMNPPFGTRENGIDMVFLELATKVFVTFNCLKRRCLPMPYIAYTSPPLGITCSKRRYL